MVETNKELKFEYSHDFLERFRKSIVDHDSNFILGSLQDVKPTDIIPLLYELDSKECNYVLNTLDYRISAQIIAELNDYDRARFLKTIDHIQFSRLLNHLDSDDAADILNPLDPHVRDSIILGIENKEKQSHIIDLLRYDEGSAGGLMAKELIKAHHHWTVNQCIEEIRRQAEYVNPIYSVYVVDERDRLLGRVSTKKIIIANGSVKIADLYDKNQMYVDTSTDKQEVAEIMRKYNIDAIPVVNAHNKLVGRITIDDVVDVITELAEEEKALMSGISGDVEEDDSIWMLSKARLPWLFIGMVGGLIGAQFIGLFERDIALIPAMAFFVPLITAMGGNVGIQSSSIMVQSLATKPAFESTVWKRLLKGLAVATLNGLVLSALTLGMNLIFSQDRVLAMVVSIALFSVILLSSFMGTLIPLFLNKLGVNPALASGPFITTANDLLGLGIYFSVAHLLI